MGPRSQPSSPGQVGQRERGKPPLEHLPGFAHRVVQRVNHGPEQQARRRLPGRQRENTRTERLLDLREAHLRGGRAKPSRGEHPRDRPPGKAVAGDGVPAISRVSSAIRRSCQCAATAGAGCGEGITGSCCMMPECR